MSRSEDSIRLEALGNLFFGAAKVSAEMDRIRGAEPQEPFYRRYYPTQDHGVPGGVTYTNDREDLAERRPEQPQLWLAVVSVFAKDMKRGEEPRIPWPATREQVHELVKAGFTNPEASTMGVIAKAVYERARVLEATRRYDSPVAVKSRLIALLTKEGAGV